MMKTILGCIFFSCVLWYKDKNLEGRWNMFGICEYSDTRIYVGWPTLTLAPTRFLAFSASLSESSHYTVSPPSSPLPNRPRPLILSQQRRISPQTPPDLCHHCTITITTLWPQLDLSSPYRPQCLARRPPQAICRMVLFLRGPHPRPLLNLPPLFSFFSLLQPSSSPSLEQYLAPSVRSVLEFFKFSNSKKLKDRIKNCKTVGTIFGAVCHDNSRIHLMVLSLTLPGLHRDILGRVPGSIWPQCDTDWSLVFRFVYLTNTLPTIENLPNSKLTSWSFFHVVWPHKMFTLGYIIWFPSQQCLCPTCLHSLLLDHLCPPSRLSWSPWPDTSSFLQPFSW